MSMALSKSKTLILGHSFIRRLEDDINCPYKPWLSHNFGLRQCDAFFVHEGGWKVSINYENFLKEVQAKSESLPAHFDAVIIQLGGNDLCLTKIEPLELASKIEDFAQWLLNKGLTKVVYVCEVFTRPHPRNVSPATYESRRSAVNQYSGTLLESARRLKFWKHKRIFNSPNNIFVYDGTHFNTVGIKKFYESLKRSIILAVEDAALIH